MHAACITLLRAGGRARVALAPSIEGREHAMRLCLAPVCLLLWLEDHSDAASTVGQPAARINLHVDCSETLQSTGGGSAAERGGVDAPFRSVHEVRRVPTQQGA